MDPIYRRQKAPDPSPVHYAGSALDHEWVQPQVPSFIDRGLDTTYFLNAAACCRTAVGCICLAPFLLILFLFILLFTSWTIPLFHH
jgi:hypothetical protein